MTRARKGFSIVELLVVVAIVTILVALIMPVIQRARESANQVICTNNLRQIGLAFQQFEQDHKNFPPNRLPCGPTWAVLILPYLEQDNLFQQWDPDFSYYDQSALARETSVGLYFCPSRRGADTPPQLSSAGDERLDADGSKGSHVRGALGDYAYNLGPATGLLPAELFPQPKAKPRSQPAKATPPPKDDLVPVPNLKGKEREKAKIILETIHLQMKDNEDYNGPGGYVAAQSPAPKTKVKRGTTVTLQFVYKVPKIIDKGFKTAKAVIHASGLLLKPQGDDEYGVVITQDPDPDTMVKRQSKVDANFAIRVPNLKDASYHSAKSAVEDVALVLNSVATDFVADQAQWKDPREIPPQWQTFLGNSRFLRGRLTQLGLVKKSILITPDFARGKKYFPLIYEAILPGVILHHGGDFDLDGKMRVEDAKKDEYLSLSKVFKQAAKRTEPVTEDFIMETILVPAGKVPPGRQEPAPRTIVPRGTVVTAEFIWTPPPQGGGSGSSWGGGNIPVKRLLQFGGWGGLFGGGKTQWGMNGDGTNAFGYFIVTGYRVKIPKEEETKDPQKTVSFGTMIPANGCSSAGLMASTAFTYDRYLYRAVEITDGLSNTFLVGEKHVPFDKFGQGGWDCALYNGSTFACSGRGVGQNLDLAGSIRDPGWKFGSYHPGICQFLFADSSVRALTVGTDPVILYRLSHHSDGNPTPPLN